MLLAAYMVAGFIVAGVYAVGLLRGPAGPAPPAGAGDPVHRRRDRHAGADLRRRRRRAGGLPERAGQVRRDRGCCRRPARTSRRCSAASWSTARCGTASRSRRAPRCWPATARTPGSAGLDADPGRRAAARPAGDDVHLAFDVMVGIGFALLGALRCGSAFGWWRRRGLPENRWFLRATAVSGVARRRRARGRLGGHRGRPPAVDRRRPAAHPATPSRRAGQPVAVLRRDRGALRGGRVRHLLRAAAAARGAGGPRTPPSRRTPAATGRRARTGRPGRRRGRPAP